MLKYYSTEDDQHHNKIFIKKVSRMYFSLLSYAFTVGANILHFKDG